MEIYYSNIASLKPKLMKFPKIKVLISYYGLKSIPTIPFCNGLFLDSGAFSAYTQQTEIDLNNYISFCKENIDKIEVYASLDDISSYKKSIQNYLRMKKENLNPIPAFHIGEPIWVLDKYLEYTNYIALGGIAKKAKNIRLRWLDNIFGKYSNIRFHGFGIQDREILKRYEWHSVDSSSTHVMARFGGIHTPWGDFKINPEVSSKDLKWVGPMKFGKVKDYFFDLLPVDLKKDKERWFDKACSGTTEGTEVRSFFNILYYENLKKDKVTPKKLKKGFDL